jgi:hypothetical protein
MRTYHLNARFRRLGDTDGDGLETGTPVVGSIMAMARVADGWWIGSDWCD